MLLIFLGPCLVLSIIAVAGGILFKRRNPENAKVLERLTGAFIAGALIATVVSSFTASAIQEYREAQIHENWHNRVINGVDRASEKARE